MMFGAGNFGWLGLLVGLAFVVGIVLIVVWAIQLGSRGAEDESHRALRVRFARGEIDAAQFEEMRRLLEPTGRPASHSRLGPIGLLLILAALVIGVTASWVTPRAGTG